MNIASVNNWPVVFCVNNNQWAISTPTKRETAAATIAAKSVAVGIPGVRVDGNDLLASYDVIKDAIDYAREGNGPVLVEFFTWRQGVHTSSDNPRIYRTEKAEKAAEVWEPMHRIKNFLTTQGVWDEEKDKKLWEDKLNVVKAAYKESIIDLEESIDDVFDHTYANLTEELKEQKAAATAYFAKKGDK
jgi:pyruvate dehydrogenase E1 component alpha subunit